MARRPADWAGPAERERISPPNQGRRSPHAEWTEWGAAGARRSNSPFISRGNSPECADLRHGGNQPHDMDIDHHEDAEAAFVPSAALPKRRQMGSGERRVITIFNVCLLGFAFVGLVMMSWRLHALFGARMMDRASWRFIKETKVPVEFWFFLLVVTALVLILWGWWSAGVLIALVPVGFLL
eukprot:Hpha_TRINITY_DN21099_c0_g1::TRINITY_DN21099_c0_g1_i1::g.103426::m.103426